MSDDQAGITGVDARSRAPIGLVVAGLIVIAVSIFVAQNTEDIEIQFLFFKGSMPLWLVIVIILVLGMVLGQALMYMRRRRKRRQDEST